MPLNPYNDAVGPMAKSVRDVALALDLVTGSDPEDPVTADAAQHISGSFAAGLDAATLKGKRIGAFRQRFVGFTGEREVAANMERVIKELQAAGAIVVDVADSRLRREVRGRSRRGAGIACAPVGPRICRADRSPATRC